MRRYWGCLLPELINNSPIEDTDMSFYLSEEELDKVGVAEIKFKKKKRKLQKKKSYS